MEIPTKEGFYWAWWIKANPGTREGDELTPGLQPEVMHVFVNCTDKDSPEYLMVEVPGVEQAQSLDCFEWVSPRIHLKDATRIATLEAEVTRLSTAINSGASKAPQTMPVPDQTVLRKDGTEDGPVACFIRRKAGA